jgi:hypothetical protein
VDATNVQAAGPDPWAEIAAELRRVADDAEKLVGEPAPSCFQIHIQPKPHDVPAAVAAVDTIALALLGKAGETRRMSVGVYHRNADAERGPISMSVYRKVPEPPTAEIERLRARLAELEARDGLHASDAISRVDPLGLAYTRADDDAADPTPTGPREPLHTGGMTEGGLVDETPGLIVGDLADEQRDNAYAAYERDEAEYLPTCPECMGQHHTVEPCR